MNDVTFSTALFFAPELSDDEKLIRGKFVKEYLYDYNAVAACLRLGFMQPFATDHAKKFLNESYTQRLIRETIVSEKSKNEEEVSVAQEVRTIKSALFKEANFHGPDSSHGARVQALGKLVTINGMEKREQTINHNHRGSVLLLPAVATNLDNWDSTVVAEQQRLLDADCSD